MNMKNRFLVLIIAVMTGGACTTQKTIVRPSVNIEPFTDTVQIDRGSLVYALPQTVLEINVTLLRTVKKAGPYASFAAELIGVTDIIRNDSEEWSVNDVNIRNHDEIDPSEYYVIRSGSTVQINSVLLTRQGLILDISSNNMLNRRRPAAGRDAGSSIDYTDMGSMRYFAVQRDTAYRLVNADTTFIRIPYLVEKKKQLSREQLAEQAAKTLLELREGRHLILTGEANVFPQSDAAINEINRLEKEYLALFAGKSHNERVNIRFYFTPQTGVTSEKSTLFMLSRQKGIDNSSDTRSVPVTISLTAAGKTKPLVVSDNLQLIVSSPGDALVYRIPEVAEVSVSEGERKIVNTRTVVHQYGHKVALPLNYIIGN